MKMIDAAEAVLADAAEPLPAQEIAQRALERGLIQTVGKTPADTISAQLAVDIKQQGSSSHFQRVGKGLFALRIWGLPEFIATPAHNSLAIPKTELAPTPASPITSESAPTGDPEPPIASVPLKANALAKPASTLFFTDAAEQVLKQFGAQKPMHYAVITKKALELGLIHTVGKTPEASLYAMILTEIAQDEKNGNPPRFVKYGKGMVGLAQWLPKGLVQQIEHHNTTIRKQLHESLHSIPPVEFEALIAELLVAIGFEDVAVTPYIKDGGIDVRGTLVVAGVIRIQMAVQAKRWKKNVQSDIVQQVRGSLASHERGLIITTSDFSAGAYEEAAHTSKAPVALMNGTQLVALLIEHGIRVHREPYYLLELGYALDD